MKKKWIWVLIVFGAMVHVGMSVKYGRDYCVGNECGVWFGDIYRARDELWQMAMAATAFNKTPFVMPVYAGAELGGYHYFYALLMFLISKSGISLLNINYVVMPVVWFGLYTGVSILLGRQYSGKKSFLWWYLGLQYAAGSAVYLLRLFKYGTILGGDDLNYQALTYSTNMPLAFGIVLFLTGIWWIKRTKKWERKNTMVMMAIIALAWGFKFYAGATCLIVFGWDLIRRKNWEKVIRLGLISAAVSALMIIWVYKPAGSVFMWKPFSVVHAMIEEKELVYLPNLVNARYFLYASGKWGPRLMAIELFSTALYFILTLGVRILGLRKWEWGLGVPALISFGLAVGLIQKGDWFNPMQFWVFGMLIFNLWTAEVLTEMKKPLAIAILILAGLGTIQLWQRASPVYIPQGEIAALEFLKKQTDGVVFTWPFIKGWGNQLWQANDTAYVTALSSKPGYFAHVNQMILTGIDYQKRQEVLRDKNNLRLSLLPVKYFYLVKKHPYFEEIRWREEGLETIFENEEVVILQKNKK